MQVICKMSAGMPMSAVAPPQPVPIFSGFDYVTVDARRRRVYAAHTESNALLIVDADSGNVLGQVKVGNLHGVAVDPASGYVFTGNGTDQTLSEVDPVTMKELRTAGVAGNVDAIAFDPSNGRIYADEDDGTHIYVVDAKTMKSVGTVDLPGHKPEYLSVNPMTHEIYQNITDLNEVAVIDPKTLKVKRTFATPAVTDNHPLQFDPAYDHVLVGGRNGFLAVYTAAGRLVGKTAIPQRGVDQCDLDRTSHLIACAGSGMISVLRDKPNAAPELLTTAVISARAHTVAIEPKSKTVWTVWPQPTGDFVQGFKTGQ